MKGDLLTLGLFAEIYMTYRDSRPSVEATDSYIRRLNDIANPFHHEQAKEMIDTLLDYRKALLDEADIR